MAHEKMDALDQLNQLACWDYQLLSFDGYRLVIAGSTDFGYYHLIEAEFAEVSFINCPTDFSHARFRLATDSEQASISRLVAIDAEHHLVAIEAETSASIDLQVFFILAESVKVIEGTVYYYERENLKPGERIAAWVAERQRTNPRT